MSEHNEDLDPEDALVDLSEKDPNPEVVKDKASVCFVEPAEGIKPRKKK